MSATSLRIAAVSLHTSPLEAPGGADAGGMNVVVLEQSLALARLGHHVDLFTRRTDPAAPAVVEIADGVRLFHLDAGPASPLAKSEMEQTITPFRAALREALTDCAPGQERDGSGSGNPDENGNRNGNGNGSSDASEGPRAVDWDLIHSHHWFSGVAALPLTRELGIPHLQSFHSVAAPEGSSTLEAGEPAESSGRIPGEQFVATGSDLVVAVSEAEARTIGERYGVPGSRLTVVRPGVDIDRFRPCSDLTERRERSPRCCSPHLRQPLERVRISPLEMLAHLPRELGARLVLAGGVSQDFAGYAEQLAASSGSGTSASWQDRLREFGGIVTSSPRRCAAGELCC